MTEQLVPDVITPITPVTLYKALQAADPTLSRASLLVLLAQIDEETGWRSCHCFNLGNIKHVPGDGHNFCAFPHNEIINGVEVWPDPLSDPFRAYASMAEGAADYLAILKRTFHLAWPAVIAGDPAQFCHLLRTQHYYTADEGLYTRNVVALDAQISREIPEEPPLAPAIQGMLAMAMTNFTPDAS